MKAIWIYVTSFCLCATGVAVISKHYIKTNYTDSAEGRKKAEQAANSISKRGTASEYKSANRHSSVAKKKTTAKVVMKDEKEIKVPKYVSNPIYTPFMNAVNKLTEELAAVAKDGDVALKNGFTLMKKNGKPILVFPEEYTRVGIGGVALGDVFNGGRFQVRRERIDDTNQEKIDEIALSGAKRLDEPEFYCTKVAYSVLPSTKQVFSIRMTGDLCVKKESNASRMVREIKQWMKEDYDAVDLHADVPKGMLALKKFKIGKGLNVEVAVNWKKQPADDGSDASIEINFTTSEVVEDNLFERQELGAAADEARVDEFNKSGVNYFTIQPKVKMDDVNRKVVC